MLLGLRSQKLNGCCLFVAPRRPRKSIAIHSVDAIVGRERFVVEPLLGPQRGLLVHKRIVHQGERLGRHIGHVSHAHCLKRRGQIKRHEKTR